MTASDLLMKMLERFGESEPIDCVVIYTSENKEVLAESNCPAISVLGMAEFIKEGTLRQLLTPPSR